MKKFCGFIWVFSLLLVVATSQFVLAAPKHNVGTHGYFRFNSGLSEGNSEQEAFIAPGATSKFRLGNEIDNFLEISLYDTYELSDGGPFIHAEGMVTILAPRGFEDVDFGQYEKFYLEAGNLTEALGNPKFWAGRRFFLGRYATHISDYAYLNTNAVSTGAAGVDGFGIHEVDAGVGKLALRLGRSKAESVAGDSIFQTNFDARLGSIQINKNGKLMLWGFYTTSSEKGAVESADGWAAGIMHTQTDLLGGSNRITLQYGEGLARDAGARGQDASLGTVTSSAQADDLEDAKTWRLVDELVIEPNSSFGLMTAFVYEDKESKDFDGTDQTWISLGVRPYWFVTDHFRVPLEVGYDYVDNKNLDIDGSLLKTTIAAEFALERGVWTRPVLRFYTTYAKWSDEFEGQIGGETFANSTSGVTTGAQIEYWW